MTAGNAPGVNDGAAAVVVMSAEQSAVRSVSPRSPASSGRRRAGLAPKMVLMTPVESVRKVAAKVGWDLE